MVDNKKDDDRHELSELLDTSYPLLAKFREACPGSYKHAQALAAMVEGISLVLDLDVTYMKVAAYYHDIGKMHNPKYFTENQLEGEDLHEELDTWISYQIITRHVSDSVSILINDSNFPIDLIRIISQHHGTGVLKYFFNKSGIEDADTYRYRNSKPTCVESAVLMIADHVEATSRSLFQSGRLEPVEVIDNTINELIDDGQLDEVYMRLGDLKQIKDALAKELEGTYQKRVDYDKAKEDRKNNETTKT
jgi:putative nucleotidyltransferase with HDIG domain